MPAPNVRVAPAVSKVLPPWMMRPLPVVTVPSKEIVAVFAWKVPTVAAPPITTAGEPAPAARLMDEQALALKTPPVLTFTLPSTVRGLLLALNVAAAPVTVSAPPIVAEGPIVRPPPAFTITAPENDVAAALPKLTAASLTVRAPKENDAVEPTLNVPTVAAAPTVTRPENVSRTEPVLAVNVPP